ncbi:MAG: LTA synthase family protein [Alphaproteobacteria bacterium]|nr:LTA synthase family protein [Alphaproteobacteria bacterium]
MHIGWKDILYYISIWLLSLVFVLTTYLVNMTNITFDGIWFHLQYVNTFSIGVVLTHNLLFFVAITFVGVALLYYLLLRIIPQHKGKITTLITMSLACLIFIKLDIINYIKLRHSQDDFYIHNWVKPEALFVGPKKPNLIMLIMESMEETFADKNWWGKNLIPNLSAYQQKGYSFSGYNNTSGTWWTMGNIVGAWCGIPLTLPTGINVLYNNTDFLGNAYCLPDILKANEYNLFYITGGATKFAGMDVFLKSHGYTDKDIVDELSIAKQNPLIYRDVWGVEDSSVYQMFKNKIIKMSQDEKPFFAAMSTIDMHTPFPKLPATCKGDKDNFYDVVSCADKQAADFIKWFYQQSFSANTVLVIVGDHLFMDAQLERTDIKFPSQNRTIFNLFINSKSKISAEIQRKFTAVDIFPTILESLGFTLKDNRAALGVSLFAPDKKQTLLERLGNKKLEQELLKNSDTYNSFLSNKFGE